MPGTHGSGDRSRPSRDTGPRSAGRPVTGHIAVIGIGPGDPDHMTPEARKALQEADVVSGYRTYVDLVRPLLRDDQQIVATGMKGEMERCRAAVDRARSGRRVAVVSSGDPGIYGMAGLVLEICRMEELRIAAPNTPEAARAQITVQVLPGVPALAAGAALLGAPLMHDFAAVSLSDLLTPWEVIEKRVAAAAEGDFVIVFYNPKSHRRDWQLDAARDVLLRSRPGTTPVGIVHKAMREGQEVSITTLEDLPRQPVDMQTVVIVGNSNTYAYGPFMITPRGYLAKYAPEDAATGAAEGAAKSAAQSPSDAAAPEERS